MYNTRNRRNQRVYQLTRQRTRISFFQFNLLSSSCSCFCFCCCACRQFLLFKFGSVKKLGSHLTLRSCYVCLCVGCFGDDAEEEKGKERKREKESNLNLSTSFPMEMQGCPKRGEIQLEVPGGRGEPINHFENQRRKSLAKSLI